MRLAVIACLVLSREISYEVAISGNSAMTFFLPQGLHNTPDILRSEIQKKIDEIENYSNEKRDENNQFDAIVLGYGLCSNGVSGLKTKSLRLIIPRCDDCIALFMGSQEKYLDYFHKNIGSYYLNAGWMENAIIPSKSDRKRRYNEFAEFYGEENAQYLIDQTYGYINNYKNFTYIKSCVFDDANFLEQAKKNAAEFDMPLNVAAADNSFIKKLINGPFSDEDFVVVEPGKTTIPTGDVKKLEII